MSGSGRCGLLNHYGAVGTSLLAVTQTLLGSSVERSREEEELSKSRRVRLCGCSPQAPMRTISVVVYMWEGAAQVLTARELQSY